MCRKNACKEREGERKKKRGYTYSARSTYTSAYILTHAHKTLWLMRIPLWTNTLLFSSTLFDFPYKNKNTNEKTSPSLIFFLPLRDVKSKVFLHKCKLDFPNSSAITLHRKKKKTSLTHVRIINFLNINNKIYLHNKTRRCTKKNTCTCRVSQYNLQSEVR